METPPANAKVVARRIMPLQLATSAPVLAGLAIPLASGLAYIGYSIVAAAALAVAVVALLAGMLLLRYRETMMAEPGVLTRRGMRKRRFEAERGSYVASFSSRGGPSDIDPEGVLSVRHEAGLFDAEGNIVTAWGGLWTATPRTVARALGVPIKAGTVCPPPERARLRRAAFGRAVVPSAVLVLALPAVVYGGFRFEDEQHPESTRAIAKMERELRGEIRDRADPGSPGDEQLLWADVSVEETRVRPVYVARRRQQSSVILPGHVDVEVVSRDRTLRLARSQRLCVSLVKWYGDNRPGLKVREITVDGLICGS